ncbi:NAD(P)/FAD-dependent oxidoreductase [Methylosinus sp. Sm6]|uniref:NAD(P)/FAD-dependent oxidoreductase n=1 Tax=Methylosinus sp. Sm6 TaxID=2866948 RepID=UPI00351CC471
MIGAGPAGLIAADRLARLGAKVTVYEHKPSPARKLLMAGRGGLNITHSENLDKFIARYGAATARLEPYLRDFPPEALRAFCAELGEDTFVGSSGRVFPKSFKASPLLRALLARLAANGVTIATRHRFEGFADDGALRLTGAGGETLIRAGAVVLALGGASWPRLGSDGAWSGVLSASGVAVTPLAPANCGVAIDWPESFRASFEGAPLKTIALRHGDARIAGDIVVTRGGLEGGPVYALSSALRRAVERDGAATMQVDLRPSLSIEALAAKLARSRGKQSVANFLRKAAGLAKLEVALLRVAAPTPPEDAHALAALVKNLPLTIIATAGLERAISTSGGVAFDELDEDLMLKRLPGVYVAGEMLDFDAPTGGYLLQAAFSTGMAAARGVARRLAVEEGERSSERSSRT